VEYSIGVINESACVQVAEEFVGAINAGDDERACRLFDPDCVVEACGFRLQGVRALERWVRSEIVLPGVMFGIEHLLVVGDFIVVHVIAVEQQSVFRCSISILLREGRIQNLVIEAQAN
jgi:hypothetical protein